MCGVVGDVLELDPEIGLLLSAAKSLPHCIIMADCIAST